MIILPSSKQLAAHTVLTMGSHSTRWICKIFHLILTAGLWDRNNYYHHFNNESWELAIYEINSKFEIQTQAIWFRVYTLMKRIVQLEETDNNKKNHWLERQFQLTIIVIKKRKQNKKKRKQDNELKSGWGK